MPNGLGGVGVGAGAALSLAGALFGKGGKVQVPPYVPVDPTQSQTAAIAGNIQNLPAAQQIAGGVNVFNQQQILQMLRGAIPGYEQMMGKGGENINALLRGELPKDVQEQIQNLGAARGLAGGLAGQIGRSATLRDLGLTSLQDTQQGLDSAMRWITMAKQTATAPLYDASSMFLSPSQRLGVDLTQQQQAYQVALMKAQVAAQPDPTQAALSNWFTQVGGGLMGLGAESLLSQGDGGGGGGFYGYNLGGYDWTKPKFNPFRTGP
jgi:hypothetical protein